MRILCYGDSNNWGSIPNINGYSKDAVIMQYDAKDCWGYSLMKEFTNKKFRKRTLYVIIPFA